MHCRTRVLGGAHGEPLGVRVAVEELEIDDFRNLSRIADFLAAKQLTPQG
jgi:hypothetical protein